MTDNQRGALYMLVSIMAFVANDGLMKSFSGTMPVTQAIALRGLGGTLLMGAILMALGTPLRGLARADGWKVAGRSVCEGAAALLFFGALFLMPLANASAIMQALPLTVTLAGAVFLGERAGKARILAILIGLGGVLLILRPTPAGFDSGAWLCVGAVAIVTLRELLTRTLSGTVPSMAVAFHTCVATFALSLPGILFSDWVGFGAWEGLKLVAAVVLSTIGTIFSIATVRVGALAAVNPFRYSSLVFSILLGLIAFGEFPDGLTLIGAAIVVATGLYTLWQEGRGTPAGVLRTAPGDPA